MSSHDEDAKELQPTFAQGYKLGEKKTVDEYAELDKGDESLNRWKASLGIGAEAPEASAKPSGPGVTVTELFLESPTLPPGHSIKFDLNNAGAHKDKVVNIKEDVEYNVGIKFKVNHGIASGLRYIHIVKRSGLKVDKLEQMLGSYGPKPDGGEYTKLFDTEESPSGMLARSGTYSVKSRVVDDDGEIYADFSWQFKITKEW